MRRKIIAFIVGVLSLVMLFASCNAIATVTVTGVELASAPTKVNYYVNESVDVTGGKLTYTYSDEKTETKDVTAEMVTGFDTTACGQKTAKITVTENGTEYSFNYDYTVTYSANVDALIEAVEELPAVEDVELADKENVDAVVAAYNALSAEEKAYFDAEEAELKGDIDAVSAKLAELVEAYEQQQAQLAEYRANKINTIKNTLKVAIFKGVTFVSATAEDGRTYTASTVDSSDVDFASSEEAVAAIASLESTLATCPTREAIDVAFDIAVADYFATYSEDMVELFKASIDKVVDAWKSTIATQLARWTAETINLAAMFEGLTMDYLSETGRWWGAANPEWNINYILEGVDAKFANATSFEAVIAAYNEIVFELTRATMQRNLEYFYAIERNLNSKYDTGDVYYWNGVSSYWDADTNMRRCWNIYSPEAEVVTLADAVEGYNNTMAFIAKDALAVEKMSLEVAPVLVYEVGEVFSVAGGKVAITYNDPNEDEVIELTDSMIVGEVVLDTVTDNGIATIKFQTKAGEQTFEIEYRVVLDKNLGAAKVEYQRAIDAEVAIFTEVYLNVMGGELNGLWVKAKEKYDISTNAAIANAASALKAEIEAAQTSEEVKSIYDAKVEAFKLALRNEYKAIAIKNVQDMVVYMRDSVKSIWGTREVENEDGTVTTTDVFTFDSTNGGTISTDYFDKVAAGHFNWHVPQMYNIAYVYDAIDFTVTADMTAEALYAAYDAAYFEVLRVVADRNIATVYFYNEAKLIEKGENFWAGCFLWLYGEIVTEQGTVLVYNGPFDDFAGQSSNAFRLWYWSFTTKEGQACLNYADLLWHYNTDLASFNV